MKHLHPYLLFPGTCQEAMEFYAECLAGEVTVMTTLADAPIDIPEAPPDKIFNSVLVAGGVTFAASDYHPIENYKAGTNFSMFLQDDAETIEHTADALGADGTTMMPFDGHFGMVLDKFGIQWMLSTIDPN